MVEMEVLLLVMDNLLAIKGSEDSGLLDQLQVVVMVASEVSVEDILSNSMEEEANVDLTVLNKDHHFLEVEQLLVKNEDDL